MKKLLPYLFAIPVLFFAQSCSKDVISPDGQYQTANITGSWVLSETAENNGSGWSYFNTGLDKGVFSFYSNSSASYEDGYSQLTGNWDIQTLSGGYYDRYGDFHNDVHQSFRIQVQDRYTNNSINLYFDDVVIASGNIIATSYTSRTVTRYIFRRY